METNNMTTTSSCLFFAKQITRSTQVLRRPHALRNINGRDVQRKIVVNNVDKLSLWAP